MALPITVTPGRQVSVLDRTGPDGQGQHVVADQENDLWGQSLIGGFWSELNRAISRRRPIERRARIARAHYHGQYPDGIQTDDPEDSDIFLQRTREVVSYGVAKIMQMINPPHEDVWDIQSKGNPVVGPRSSSGQKSTGEESGDAAAKQEEKDLDDLKVRMRDQLVDMEWDEMRHDCAFQLGLYGTAFFFGPIKADDARLLWDDETGEWTKDPCPEDKWNCTWKNLRFWDVFLDPEGIRQDLKDCEFFFVKHLMTKHQLRQLARDPSFDKDAIEQVLEDVADAFVGSGPAAMSYEIYDPHSDSIVSAVGRTFQDRYAIWMRVGVLGKEELEKLPDQYHKVFEKNGKISHLEGAIFETWFCGDTIMRMKAREFQPDKLPLIVVPLEVMDGSPYGRGWAEMIEAVQRSQNSLARSMEDTLRHASGYQAVVDLAQIPVGTDLSIRGRKTWLTRSLEGHKSNPVDFQIIPTNQADMIAALEFWEKMVPIVTSMPRMNPQDLGSGVRTEGMQEAQLSAMETFIKLTIGNLDRYFIKPIIKDLFLWNKVYDEEHLLTGIYRPVATGVLGAIRREIVGRKAAALMDDLSKIGSGDAIDDFELLRMRTQGLGMDGTRLVLSPDALVHKRAAAAQQERLKAMATARGTSEGEDRVRAETSVRDALVSAMGNIPDPNNPVWAPAMMKLYESVGEVDSTIATALAVWSRKVALDFQRIGAANPQEVATLSQGFVTTNPAEVAPGPERDAAAKGQPVGDTSAASQSPMNAMPMAPAPPQQQFENPPGPAAPPPGAGPGVPPPPAMSAAALPGQ